jgi:hypothetical protein
MVVATIPLSNQTNNSVWASSQRHYDPTSSINSMEDEMTAPKQGLTDAQCAVTQEVDTWAKKIGESRDPFEHANNVTSAAESEFPNLPIRGRKYPKEMFAGFEWEVADRTF